MFLFEATSIEDTDNRKGYACPAPDVAKDQFPKGA